MEPCSPNRAPDWGAWEAGATTILFWVPALILYLPGADRGPGREAFDSVDWIVVGAGLGGALGLTLAARGARGARLFLSTGLLTCVMLLLTGRVLERFNTFALVYKPLALATLAAHCNLVPLALFGALRRLNLARPDDIARRIRRKAWGVVASVAALDLAPFVYYLTPPAARLTAAVAWVTICVAAGGALAALAAGEIASQEGSSR